MSFEIKTLSTETLSDYLREVREGLGLSVMEASQAAEIKPEHLVWFESNRFHRLPPDVYACGFLKKLAAVYVIDGEVLVAQFKKERRMTTPQASTELASTGWSKTMSRLLVTPKLLSIAAGLSLVCITLGYIMYQVVSLNGAPQLHIAEPQDGQIVAQSFVQVRGSTDPGSIVKINNASIFVDSSGNFSTTVGVTPGQTALAITAQNKFNKTVEEMVTVVAEQAVPQVAGAVSESSPKDAPLVLQLDFTESTTIAVTVDEVSGTPEVLTEGGSKLVRAQQKILLSTSNAGATRARFNGRELGVLGRPGETLRDIPFLPDAANVVSATPAMPSPVQ
jgi:cytoskeletal protein RodZ